MQCDSGERKLALGMAWSDLVQGTWVAGMR